MRRDQRPPRSRRSPTATRRPPETVSRISAAWADECDLDEDALAVVFGPLRQIAEKEGRPLGTPMEYDLFHFQHHARGGR